MWTSTTTSRLQAAGQQGASPGGLLHRILHMACSRGAPRVSWPVPGAGPSLCALLTGPGLTPRHHSRPTPRQPRRLRPPHLLTCSHPGPPDHGPQPTATHGAQLHGAADNTQGQVTGLRAWAEGAESPTLGDSRAGHVVPVGWYSRPAVGVSLVSTGM